VADIEGHTNADQTTVSHIPHSNGSTPTTVGRHPAVFERVAARLRSQTHAVAALQSRVDKLAETNKRGAPKRQRACSGSQKLNSLRRSVLHWSAAFGRRTCTRSTRCERCRSISHVSDDLYRNMVPDLNLVVKSLFDAIQSTYGIVRQFLTDAERDAPRQSSSVTLGESSPSPSNQQRLSPRFR
jgi:hypothetical protein